MTRLLLSQKFRGDNMVAIPQPFTAKLPPCLEKLYAEGAKGDTKTALYAIGRMYQDIAQKSNLEDSFYNLVPMMEYINSLSEEKLSLEAIDLINDEIRNGKSKSFTCLNIGGCPPEKCKLFKQPSLNPKHIPACIEHAKQHGPAPDDGLAWCINLGKWFKLCGATESVASMHVSRLFDHTDSLEDLDIEEIGLHVKTAFNSATELSCKELMGSASFQAGCTYTKCQYYDRPVFAEEDRPGAQKVYLSDPPGSTGLDEDGAVKVVVSKDDRSYLKWVSDCACYIATETLSEDETEFVFEGVGAVDKRKVRFTMQAADCQDSRKLKGMITNAFGAANRLGELTFDTIQKITRNTIKRRRLTAPAWVDGKPMVPGVGLADDIEFKLLDMVPAHVHDGDLVSAKNCLKMMLDIPGPTPILVAAVMGAPIYALHFPNDRFGVGMWGRSGSLKTSISKKAMCVYGEGYNDDINLLKFGRNSSTGVGQSEVLGGAGFLPHIIDNVKSVDPRDAQQYIATVHSVIEGKDKVRGKKDGGIRNSKAFCCTPIVTGEVKPDEASTSARILNLKWSEPKDKTQVDYVAKHIKDLPVIGYHWLRYLASEPLNLAGFEEARTAKTDEFNSKNYVNSGRLATIYTLLRATWAALLESPFKDVFESRSKRFLEELDRCAEEQGAMVSEETEVAKFLSGIDSILATQPHLIQNYENQLPDEYGKTYTKDVIGRWVDDNLFLVPNQTLFALKRLGVFTQIPSEGSLTDALSQADCLVRQKSGRRKVQQNMNQRRIYGWLLKGDQFKMAEEDKQESVNVF